MGRELHLHIYDASDARNSKSPGGAAPSRYGSDPEADLFTAQPDDPEADLFTAQPDDPEADLFTAEPDDPGAGLYGASLHGNRGRSVAVFAETRQSRETSGGCGCSCGCPGASSKLAEPPARGGGSYTGFVIVRLRPGYFWPSAIDLCQLACELELVALAEALRIAPADQAAAEQGPLLFWRELGRLFSQGEPLHGHCFVSRPLIELRSRSGKIDDPRSHEASFAQVAKLERRAGSSRLPPLHSLNSYWRVDLRSYPQRVQEVVEKLRAVAEVELVYRELAARDSAASADAAGERFSEDQGYLQDAPIGTAARWARSQLPVPSSPGLAICDLEQGWGTGHENLSGLDPILPFGRNRDLDGVPGHHGAAVLGEIAGNGLGLGVEGAASGLARFVLSSHYRSRTETEPGGQEHPFAGNDSNVANALVAALATDDDNLPFYPPPPRHPHKSTPLQPGDILLLEVQRGLLPAEIDSADFDAIRLAGACGIVVVAAAGNGGFDLDAYLDPDSGRSLQRGHSQFRDSGSLLVGAARASLPHDRAPFSNFGSRIDCYGWGEGVISCGYGDLWGTSGTDFYTSNFNGTSSAAPIVAGAAALLQLLHQKETGQLLDPLEMRTALANPATGTAQGPNVAGKIGVMPNLRAICGQFLQLAPDVYLRRTIADDGSAAGTRGPIAVCPEILLTFRDSADPLLLNAGAVNFPAPGTAFRYDSANFYIGTEDRNQPPIGEPSHLYLRFRNGGHGPGAVQTEVFGSPASTLITPERWAPLGEARPLAGPSQVGDGHLPVLWEVPQWTKHLDLTSLARLQPAPVRDPAWTDVRPPLSFLAVQRETEVLPFDCSRGLPPGPPYFDWNVFRGFLRSRKVAWRNIHPVRAPAAGGPATRLAFLIAGTPDQARHFDFEIVARLPAATRVELEVPEAFAAKLRQNQSWRGGGSGPKIELPRRPRTSFSRVRLAPAASILAFLTLSDVEPLPGHSIAIRQLWRGEEVGRVTFYFVSKDTE